MQKFKYAIYHNYPFTLQFLKDNIEYIDWGVVIWNRYIDWNVGLLELIKDKNGVKWKFRRNEILRNSKIAANQNIIFHYFDCFSINRLPDNQYIVWDEKMLDKLKGKIEVGRISKNLEVSLQFIEKNKEAIDWGKLSWNNKIDWTPEFIDKHKEWLNWRHLSWNTKLPWNDELIEKFEDYWDWSALSKNSNISWTEPLIDKYQKSLNWQNLSYHPNADFSIKYLESNLDKFDIYGLSRNRKIGWNDELISKYENDLNFSNYGLSWNNTLSWSKELLDKYRSKWSWSGISSNYGIPWTEQLIDYFSEELIWGRNDNIEQDSADASHRSNGFCLSNNPKLPWSLEFIEKYKNRFRAAPTNTGIWEKVLKPILTEEKVSAVIRGEKLS